MNNDLLIKKMVKKGGFKTPFKHEDMETSYDRARRWNSAKGKGDWLYVDVCNVIEFTEFPVIAHFMSCYKVHPSIFKIDFYCNYDFFIKRIQNIKKTFYLDSLNIDNSLRDIDNANVYKKFICLGDRKRNCFYYITITGGDENKHISITVLFNPKEDSIMFFDKIKKEVFYNLPEEKEEKESYLNIMVSTPSGYKLERIKVNYPLP